MATIDLAAVAEPLGEGEEETIDVCKGTSDEENKFDAIVGALEEVLLDGDFVSLQDDFCTEHCGVFEDTDENKLQYTEIFFQYTERIEGFIAERLTATIEGFDMEEFGAMLEARPDEVTGDVFDTLLSLSEFDEFKALMLSYKARDEGGSLVLEGLGGAAISLGPAADGSGGVGHGGGGRGEGEGEAKSTDD
eukprot:g5866.t1